MVTSGFGLTWPEMVWLNKFHLQTMLKHSNAKLLKGFTLLFVICLWSWLHFKSFFFLSRLFNFPKMKKALEERLQWRKLINRLEDQHCGKLWEPRKQSRVCSKHFLNGKPTEAYSYPTENLGYTSTFKQKKKRKTLVRQENIKIKNIYIYTFRNMIVVFKRNPTSCPNNLDSITLAISCCI